MYSNINVLKIICTCVTARKERVRPDLSVVHHDQYAKTPKDVLEMIHNLVLLETTWEQDIKTDVLLYNNSVGDEYANNVVLNLNGTKLHNGTLTTKIRENTGGSYGAYNDGVIDNLDKYTHFIFTEDDIMIGGHNYSRDFYETHKKNEDTGVLCIQGLSANDHAHGGVMFIKNTILRHLLEKDDNLAHYQVKDTWDYGKIIQHGEVALGKQIRDHGFKLVDYINGLSKFTFDTNHVAFYTDYFEK